MVPLFHTWNRCVLLTCPAGTVNRAGLTSIDRPCRWGVGPALAVAPSAIPRASISSSGSTMRRRPPPVRRRPPRGCAGRLRTFPHFLMRRAVRALGVDGRDVVEDVGVEVALHVGDRVDERVVVAELVARELRRPGLLAVHGDRGGAGQRRVGGGI